MYKRFDKQLFDEHDEIGRKAVKRALGKIVALEDNPDIYGIDLVGRWKGNNIKVEVDHKAGWVGSEFPFDTVVVTGRKEKFMQEDWTFHAVVNRNCTALLFASMKDIKQAPTKNLPNKYMPNGERVFDVPFEKFVMVQIPEQN